MLKRAITFLLGLIVIVWGQSVGAQENVHGRNHLVLPEMVVTGTKFPTEIERVPGRIDVLDAQEIEDMPYERVDELLQQLSGLQTSRTDGIFELSPQVTMRGLGGNVPARTLVLIDGMPASVGDTGNFRWNRVNQANIERIEVFKGPGSSIYGSNAMGGVINIITKKPDEPVVADVSAGYGSFDTKQGSTRVGFRKGEAQGFFGQISATGLDSEGHTSLTPESRDYEARRDRFVEEYTVDTTLGYDFDPYNTLQLSYSYFDDRRGEGYKYNIKDGAHREFDTNNVRLAYNGELAGWQMQVNGFYQKEDYFWHRDFADPDSVYTVNSDREDYGTNISVSTDVGEISTVTFGGDFRISSVDAIDDEDSSDSYWKNKGKQDQYALYLQDELRLLDGRLILVGGLRYDYAEFHDGSYESNVPPYDQLSTDHDQNTWDALSPKISARYNFSPEASIFASYSRGFRAPILDSLCRYGIFHGRFYDANPELENETLDSFEVGADISIKKDFDVSLSTYYSRGEDFIYAVDTGETRFLWGRDRNVYLWDNVTEVQILGLEADLTYRLTENMQFFANYTYNRSTIEEFNERPELEGKRLEYVPEHSANAGAKIMSPWLNAQVVLNHVGSQYINDINTEKMSSYETVDVKLWRTLDFLSPKLSASLTIENLFDKKHLRSEDEESPGIFVVGELSYAF